MDRIEKTMVYLKEAFENADNRDARLDDLNYRYEHSIRVANIGKTIAIEEGLNRDALVVACLLHDISYVNEFKSAEEAQNHGRLSASMVKDFINTLGFDDDTVQEMLYGIAAHVDDVAGFEGKHTLISESVSDSDNIDRFDVYRIYEGLRWEDFNILSLDEKRESSTKRLAQLERLSKLEFSTPTARRLWNDKIEFYQEYTQRLLSQINHSSTI